MTQHAPTGFLARLIAVLWAANMIQLGLRYSWGVALPQASAQLGLSGLEAGLIASSFYVGYVVAGVPSGILVDRLGSKRATLIGLVGVGALSLGIAASQSFPELLATFLFSGVLAGPIFPSSLKTLSSSVGRGARGTGVGALESVSPAAMIVAATLFPPLVDRLGWREVYVAIGVAAFAVCALYAHTVGEEAGWGGGLVGRPAGFGSLLRNRGLVWAVSVRLGGMWGIIGLSAWYYDFAYRLYGPFNAQILYLILASSAVVGQVVGGVVSDRRSRAGVASVGMALFGLTLTLTTLLRGLIEAYALAPMVGFTAFFWKSGLDTYILESVEPSQRGSASGFMNTVSQVGSLIAPSAVGYALDTSGALSPLPTLTLALGPLVASLPMLAGTLGGGTTAKKQATHTGTREELTPHHSNPK